MSLCLQPTCSALRRLRGALLAGTALAILGSHPAFAIDVFNETDLRSAIETARTTPNTEIVLRGNITLSQDLPALQGIGTTIRSDTGSQFAINGANTYRGLFVYSGSATVQDLTITNAVAKGGDGGEGGWSGGGGAGLGGALFVNAGATVTVANVNLNGNVAQGGAGGNSGAGSVAGGGGMGGAGGASIDSGGGGGGGIGAGAAGGNAPGTNGAAGIAVGAANAGNGAGGGAPGTGGADGGGGGAGAFQAGGGGGVGGASAIGLAGGNGGFGGGGGGGMGGAIFVVEGGTLNLQGNLTVNGNAVTGGTGVTAGSAFGSGLFLQGNGTLAFNPAAGSTQTISDGIADQSGSGGSGTYATGGPICTTGVGCAGYSGEGVWGLSKTGTGTLVLNGNNTFTGGVTINGGTISAGHNNALGTGTFTVLGSTLDIQNGISISNATDLQADLDINVGTGATGTHAGDISSTGAFGINKIGSGTLVFSGVNIYTGATNVNDGTLRAGATNTFSTNSAHVVTTGTTLDLNNFSQTIGSLAGAGHITLGTATLTTGGNNTSTTFSGTMSGSGGFTKEGTGMQTFSGTQDHFGATTVNAGTLVVNGSLTNSSTVVNGGGAFGGIGNVQDITVNGGVFAPGNGTAGSQMTVAGNVNFAGGGIYRVFVDPAAVSSAIVNGTANLSGGIVNAQFALGAYVARQYVIMQTGGIAGTFNEVIANNVPVGFAASVLNLGDDVVLRLNPALANVTGLPVNQQNVVDALSSYFNSGGGLPPAFATLFGLTGDALRNALSHASGEPGASVSTSTFIAWNSFFNMIFDPFAENRGGFGGGAIPFAPAAQAQSEEVRLAYAAVTPKRDLKDAPIAKAPALADPFASRWSVWGGGYGGSATTEGNAQVGSHDTTSRAYGFAAGADRRLSPDTLIGFALAGGGTSFGLDQGLGGGTSDMFQASVYARQNWGAAYLMGALGYGWQDFSMKRTVSIAGTDKLEADFNANTFAGRAEGGWRVGGTMAGLTPYAAVQVVSLDLPSFTERATSGANTFALAYAGRTDTQTRSEFGARLDYAMPMRDALLTLRGRAAWAHDYDTDRIANAGFMALPGTAFTVNGAQPDADSLLVSAGAELALLNGVSLAGSFEGEFSGNTQSYAGKGAVRYRW